MTNKRHKIEEREEFTDQQKAAIAAKSNDTCVWCGKKVFIGYGGTIDHFVPLKKGGTNDFQNLVLMCHDCNQKKGSKVIPIHCAASHLNKEYKEQLSEYFQNYLHTFDYISRGNLLACDWYPVYFMPEVAAEMLYRKGNKANNKTYASKSNYILKRAYPDDEGRITEYYTKYLKKYKMLSSPEAASENIKFWMRFGSIYYIEKGNDISVISATTVSRNGFISINLFSYYSTRIAMTLTEGIVTCLGDAIMSENDLPYLPLSVNILMNDSLAGRILNFRKAVIVDGRLACQPYFTFNKDYPEFDSIDDASEEFKEGVKRFQHFISRFKDIEDSIQLYLYENNLMSYSWMADEILERDLFDEVYYRPIGEFTDS